MNSKDIIAAWNEQSDEYNQWDTLDKEEAVVFTLGTIKDMLEEFRPLLEEWKAGTPVTKVCYGLNNDHMKALQRVMK